MGYESTLYIVNKTNTTDLNNDLYYAQVIASVELCKVIGFANWFCSQPETDCYFYADDGNTGVIEDDYGDKLKEASLADTLEKLEELATADSYWRYKVTIDLLTSIIDANIHLNGYNIVVLHYGH